MLAEDRPYTATTSIGRQQPEAPAAAPESLLLLAALGAYALGL